MVQLAIDRADQLLESREVHQKPDRIELRSFERHAHAIIVAVQILALTPVTAQGISCRKSLFYADLKHVSPKIAAPLAADLSGSWPFRRDLPNGLRAPRSHNSHPENRRHRR